MAAQQSVAQRLSSAGTANALELRGVSKTFGALAALTDITMTVQPGERRARIAKGSGRPVHEVNKLLKQFAEMRKMMKQMGKLAPQLMRGGGPPDINQLMG